MYRIDVLRIQIRRRRREQLWMNDLWWYITRMQHFDHLEVDGDICRWCPLCHAPDNLVTVCIPAFVCMVARDLCV